MTSEQRQIACHKIAKIIAKTISHNFVQHLQLSLTNKEEALMISNLTESFRVLAATKVLREKTDAINN